MDATISDAAREAMLGATLSRVGREGLKAALARSADPRLSAPTAVVNAVNALRRHPDPVAALGKAQYRAVLPYAAAAFSDNCLAATIEALGDHADDPTRDQLLEALDAVRDDHDDLTMAVMLASVANGDMPASDLCLEVLATDSRYGVTSWAEPEVPTRPAAPVERAPSTSTTSPERREERRLRKRRDAEQRRRAAEVAREAEEQSRKARRKARVAVGGPAAVAPAGEQPRSRVVATHVRRATLTPAQEEEFDRDDRWVSGIVYVWVPFDAVDPELPELDGKTRPCVVVAGSATHLLVRPGYSDRGVKSRDWKSVPVSHWRRAGFAQPTWIDVEMVPVERPAGAPLGWLETEDWNALW